MTFPPLTWSADVAVGDWIAPRLAAFGGGRVDSVVPGGFQAYIRILHPVQDGRTWADVCAETGATAHAAMQWNAISRYRGGDTCSDAEGVAPRLGNLEPAALQLLYAALAPSVGAQLCWFALWEGWGWFGGGTALVSLGDPADPMDGSAPALSPSMLAGPKLELPFRAYHLFSGPLEAVFGMGWHHTPDWFQPQSPSLFWPQDRSWCVATEIDFDSTLVGGSRELVDRVLASGLEAWEVHPRELLSDNGDTVNQ